MTELTNTLGCGLVIVDVLRCYPHQVYPGYFGRSPSADTAAFYFSAYLGWSFLSAGYQLKNSMSPENYEFWSYNQAHPEYQE
jgi:hypothetical protein